MLEGKNIAQTIKLAPHRQNMLLLSFARTEVHSEMQSAISMSVRKVKSCLSYDSVGVDWKYWGPKAIN